MKSNNPHRTHIPLYPSQPSTTQNDSGDESSDFPSIRIRDSSPPIPSISAFPRSARPGETQRDSQPISLSSGEEPTQSQYRRQQNKGLGETNILNTVGGPAFVQHPKVRFKFYIVLLITNENSRKFVLVGPNPR